MAHQISNNQNSIHRRSLKHLARGFLWCTLLTVVLLGLVWILLDDYLTLNIERWLQNPAHSVVSYPLLVILILGSDLFLPIPSSAVMTHCGMTMGLWWAITTSFVGLNSGSVLGFGLGRWMGQGIIDRWISPEDQQWVQQLVAQRGVVTLIMLRPIPIFAEASLLVLGAAKMSWRRFLPWMLAGNLGICITFTGLGIWTIENEFPQFWAILISIFLPLIMWLIVRRLVANKITKAKNHVHSESTV